ncbi:hypothetical protein [Oceanicola sp. 502str15]|uniref:hypothetical protein n=1 Tax=Oceanicola sp. 502str15 TaxID=2696061 RepID=UPI0020944649|nr:hypothetical protein [Oceanicola sp. 502str15]MCO6385266.1 hypothetical protein [Oceanicola sp. 502str15]
MKQFEYDIVFFEVRKRKDYAEMRRGLNVHGANGWEVISVEPSGEGYTLFLKREIEERQEETTP